MMKKRYDVEPEQAIVLEELEELVGKTIPIVEKNQWDTFGVKEHGDLDGIVSAAMSGSSFGVKVKGDKVVGLNLYSLDLSSSSFLNTCNLRTLPESIGNLKTLEVLNLKSNKLSTLPESIGKLSSLQELDLNSNILTTLPESIGNLSSLKRLNLSGNIHLSTLPESIGKLTSLQKLYLGSNKLTTLPESIGDLSSLERLYLGSNKLTTLPESIGNLTSLRELSLGSNQFSTLPESIGNLTSLRELSLGENQFTTLPESIGNLSSLKDLSLYDNKLTTLPESITKLTSLQKLYLGSNKLTTLPESIKNLKSLKEIDLSKNKWKGEWARMSDNNIPTILNLCRKLHGIVIFISHAMNDEKTYHIRELSNFLEKSVIIRENDMDMNIIHNAVICETDILEDIWDFMTESVPKSHLLLFVATKNSIKSEACRYELFLANKYDVKILPIKGADITWEELNKIELVDRQLQYQGDLDLSTPEKKFELNRKNFDEICEKLSEYIKKHESKLKKGKAGMEIVENVKNSIITFIHSKEFRAVMKDRIENFEKIFRDVSNEQITILEYYLKLGVIINEKKSN